MSYISLYRKYRPITFDSIVGQSSVTKILKSQIKNSKISHAYIFSGSRGTGKTSAAKIFSRAINCLHPKDGEPCNECEVCRNILEGNSTDVIEMDAASNNSVENIRQIRQEVVYSTIDVKYRVYIIDEAHMLTTSAFNALLKTLEEPPENVVFILATTEQHKIPVTILSRCLRFDFNKISENDIIERLKYVLAEENIKYEEEAIKYIAKLSDGGMRDALSILERCITENTDILKYDDVLKIVGAIDKNVIDNIIQSISNNDSITILNVIDEISNKGKDLRQFNSQLIEGFLDKLINSDDTEKNKYIKIIDKLSKLDNELRLTSKPIILLKSTLIEICNDDYSLDTNVEVKDNNENKLLKQKIISLEQEMELLKQKINNLSINRPKVITTKVNKINNEEESKNEKEVDDYDEKNLVKFDEEEEFKKSIIEHGKIKIYSSLANSNLYLSGNKLVIITNNTFAYSVLNEPNCIDEIKNIYESNYGKIDNIVLKLNAVDKKNETDKLEEELEKGNNKYTSID